MKSLLHVCLVATLMSCSSLSTHNRIVASDDNPELPVSFQEFCTSQGGELYQVDCRCKGSGLFIDPYTQSCQE